MLRARKYDKVYIPYYTCDVVLEPFKKLGIPYEFYHIGLNLEICEDFSLQSNEGLLYTNYYGLKQRYVEELTERIGNRLIVDNTQAFYAKPVKGIDTYYTCRKFFGVPDGAYLYTDLRLEENFEQDLSFERMTSLTKRLDLGAEAGYADFREISKSLVGQPIKWMSNLTQRMMQGIDYSGIAQRRRDNYIQLHSVLGKSNTLHLSLEEDAVPMIYPFLTPIKDLREKLIANKVFVARYWPNVLEWTSKDHIDYQLASLMQPLPIDQRYGKEDMNIIIHTIEGIS